MNDNLTISHRGETISRSNFYNNSSNNNNITTSASVNNIISLSNTANKTNTNYPINANNSELSYARNEAKSLNKYK